MAVPPPPDQQPAAFRGLVGVARRDVTPPVGIHARMWGAATHDVATGIHRPLTVTVLALAARAAPPRLLVALDAPLLGSRADAERVVGPVREALGLTDDRLLVNCSHTHAAPWAATTRSHLPGGELIEPYLAVLGSALREAGVEAVAALEPATLTWATGRCDLARNRDLPLPGAEGRVVCGLSPAAPADDTVLVGRVTRDADGAVTATLVNYACHPTTLAWENSLVSPDYPGAMRETVESATGGAPCLFLHGASGELAPAHQYVGDPAVADRHGRRLGLAALSALEGMLPPGEALRFDRVVESGAPLAVWSPARFEPSGTLAGGAVAVELPIRSLPSPAAIEAELETTADRALRERLFRRLRIVRELGQGPTHPFPAWVWRVGDALVVAHPNEAYSSFQVALREAFPGSAVVVMNTTGVGAGYLYPPELVDADVYQVWQSPFDRDALPTLLDRCLAEGRRLLADA